LWSVYDSCGTERVKIKIVPKICVMKIVQNMRQLNAKKYNSNVCIFIYSLKDIFVPTQIIAFYSISKQKFILKIFNIKNLT